MSDSHANPGAVPVEPVVDVPPVFPDNPGSFEDLHRSYKDVAPTWFEGIKVLFNKPLSSHLQINHALHISDVASGYRFGATYVGSKRHGPETFPVAIADTDFDGNVSASFVHQITDRIRCKFMSQAQSHKLLGSQITNEFRTRNSTTSISLANFDLSTGSGLVAASFLRRHNASLDLGLEVTYQRSYMIPGGQCSMLNCGVRYNGNGFAYSATGGLNGLHLTYFQAKESGIKFGVELDADFNSRDSIATFAYQADFKRSNTVFKASVNTNMTVTATLEKRFQPLPFSIAISALVNCAKNVSRIGFGFVIGS